MLGTTLASGKAGVDARLEGVRKLMGDEAMKQRADGSFDKFDCEEKEEGRGACS